MTTQNERLARLEERVQALEEQVDKMNGKLDDLLALRNKGAGVFWLMSLLMGTGIAGFIYSIFGGR